MSFPDWHIREVLLPYARTHLTVDHVAYTEWAIEQLLLEALTFVPIADATSFLLPTDPFEALIRHLDSLNLKPYEERLTISECAVQFIRTIFSPLPHLSELRAQKCWLEEGCRYKMISSIYRPMTPILTQRARHETPKLGGTGALASIPRSRLSLKTHWILDFVADEVIVDPPTPDFNDVLDVRYKLDMASRVKIRSLVQEALEPARNNSGMDDAPRIVDFFRSISPTRYPARLESPPLFPRVGRTVHKAEHSKDISLNGPAMNRIADIAPMVKSASAEVIEEEEGDMLGHHMQVVNGWSTHTISSPPSYHRNSSSSSDVNELWDISPSGSPPTSLIVAKMEEIEIPRTRKFGHGVGPKDELTNGGVGILFNAKNPGPFITSVITQNSVSVIHNTSVTACQDAIPRLRPPASLCSPSCSAANSLLGQAPSTSEEHDKNIQLPTVDEGEMGMEVDLDTAISNIYASSCDPVTYILEEKLDEKEVLLMDVPNLPPPTAYPRLHIERMSSLVSAKGANLIRTDDIGKASGTGIGFLSPVKGLKPLALGLSWIPFKFGRSMPTNEDVVRVADKFYPEDDTTGYIDPKVEANIRQLCASPEAVHVDGQNTEGIVRRFENLGASPIPKQDENWDEVEYVLTRRERNKLAVNAHILEGDDNLRQSLNIQSEGLGQSECDAECRQYRDLANRGKCDFNSRPESRGFCFPMSPANGENRVVDDMHGLEDPPAYDRVSALDQGYHLQEVDELEANKENIDNNVNVVGSENVPDSGVLEDRNLSVTPLGSRHVLLASVPSRNEELSITHNPHLAKDSAGDSVRKSSASRAVTHAEHQPVEHPIEASQEENAWLHASKRRKLDHLLPATAKELFTTFLGLRNKLPLESLEDRPVTPYASDVPIHTELPQRATPDEIVDKNTVRLAQWNNPTTTQRYLASMALIQKRAVVLELLSEACKVILVERYSLGGCEIVLDPDRAILLAPLLALPAQVDALSDRISAESWRYSDILVVFEAYPSARSCRVGDARSVTLEPYPYSPPIIKAIKKLRRIVSIAEGCGSKNKLCSIIWAFAHDVKETAKFVRCFGDEAAGKAAGSAKEALWDEREWLDDEEREGESDLAMAEGMNPFSAVVMLYGWTLEHIFEMSPQGRLEEFGGLIGEERMEMLNSVIMQRKQEMAMTSER